MRQPSWTREEYLGGLEPADLEVGEAVEIAVLCEDRGRPVLEAERCDLRVMDEVAPGSRFDDELFEEAPERRPRTQDAHRRAAEHGLECLHRSGFVGWWGEDSRVSRDPEELGRYEHGKRPRLRALDQALQTLPRGFVLGKVRAVRVQQDVGVDGDQRSSSIRS